MRESHPTYGNLCSSSRTLIAFDQLKLYNFTSEDFHFKTYIFDLNSSTYNPEESAFMKSQIEGYWLAKGNRIVYYFG